MSSVQGGFISGRSVGGGATFVPMKAAPPCEDKKARLPVYENIRITDRAGLFPVKLLANLKGS